MVGRLEETKKEILLYLSMNRSGYYYGIYKYLALKRGTRPYLSHVWRALQGLKSEHVIESHKCKKHIEKGQKKGPYYRLTLIGLLKIFTYDDFNKYLGSIIENHANKALIFSEWDYFERQGVKQKIIEAIKDFYNSYVLEDSHRPKGVLGLKRERPSMKRELNRHVLFYHMPLVRMAPLFRIENRTSNLMSFEQFRAYSFPWIEIWFNRRKLRQCMIKEITQEQILTRDALIHIMEAKQYIKSLAQAIQLTPSHYDIHKSLKQTRSNDWTLK
jgi:hypothetical protein